MNSTITNLRANKLNMLVDILTNKINSFIYSCLIYRFLPYSRNKGSFKKYIRNGRGGGGGGGSAFFVTNSYENFRGRGCKLTQLRNAKKIFL